jgi:hypothetical protein
MGFMIARRLILATLGSLCVLSAGLVFPGRPALAARGHLFEGSFGKAGSGAGDLSDPSGVAVSEATGDVYVVDKGNDRVEYFTSTGAYVGEFNGSGLLLGEGRAAGSGFGETPTGQFEEPEGIAVDNSCSLHKTLIEETACRESDPSAGDVYVVDAGHGVVDKFSSTGAYVGQLTFGQLRGVAVNSTGELWVYSKEEVSNFSDAAANEFIASRRTFLGGVYPEKFSPNHGLAVDSKDNLYENYLKVKEAGATPVELIEKFNSNGEGLEQAVDSEESTAVAVELSSDDVYVDNVGTVGRFTPEGVLIERLGEGRLTHGVGVGVSSSSEIVYVADSSADVVEIYAPEEPSKPSVVGESVVDVAGESATLQAEINPRGSSTLYHFEYGSCATPSTCASGPYEKSAPVPAGFAGSEFVVATVSPAHVQGLSSGTVYRYRVVAENEIKGKIKTTDGPEQTFTTQVVGGELMLPDGRAWELVSPADKKGALIKPSQDMWAASDGRGIAYLVEGTPMGENPMGASGFGISQVLSMDGSGGWRSVDINTPQSIPKTGESSGALLFNGGKYGAFSQDLSSAVVYPSIWTPLSSEALEGTPYLRSNTNGSYVPLMTPANVPPGTKLVSEKKTNVGYTTIVAETPDLSHLVIDSPVVLTPEAVGGTSSALSSEAWGNLYEWVGGRLQLVNILPNGEPVHEKPKAQLAGTTQYEAGSAARVISTDGRRVAWTVGYPYEGSTIHSYSGLYVRDMVEKRTVRVGGQFAIYQTMSADGSRVFFLENGDLYEFDMDTGVQMDLTPNHGASEADAGVLEAVSDVSEDGSYVYFVAKGFLAPGAVSGGDNLYLLHEDGGEWSTRYVTTLSSEDENDWHKQRASNSGATELKEVTSRVSPDGHYLAFMSDRSLTGYDNIDAMSGQPDEEVYLYDALAGRVVCISCDPTGGRPVGELDHTIGQSSNGLLVDSYGAWNGSWLAGNIPAWTNDTYQSRYLSDSGRLFFNSIGPLVPQDTDGVADVYEYEPVGVGGCTAGSVTFSERSGGCVNLISSGTSSAESAFIDASENGDDAFFITSNKLVAEDYDTAYDVYDAHACSASTPCVTAPESPPPCTSGDSCKAAPSPQPEIFGPAPSATFSGAGNVVEEAQPSVVKRKPKPKAKPKKHAKQRKGKGKRVKRSRTGKASGKDGK